MIPILPYSWLHACLVLFLAAQCANAEDVPAGKSQEQAEVQVKSVGNAHIDRFINELGSDDFSTRARATKALDTIGGEALQALRNAAIASKDPEVSRRAESLAHVIENR